MNQPIGDPNPLLPDQVPADPPKAIQGEPAGRRSHQILVVDDEPANRTLCLLALRSVGLSCEDAADGFKALDHVRERPCDLVLLDVDMPGMTGVEVLRRLRERPPCPHLKVVMMSGRVSPDEMSQWLLAGANDFLAKPFSLVQLQARVKAALALKDAQDHSDQLNRHLLELNAEMERTLRARDSDLVDARNALVLALAKLVGRRDTETGAHLLRLQRYTRRLAEEAAPEPAFASPLDAHFIQMLECCAPLHDIGKMGLPDSVLLKPGRLTPEERALMQTHTVMGAETLAEVGRQHVSARAMLETAVDIARSHHERWDGAGYPDGLAADAIPLSARVVALGDVYDALRSPRVYKPGYDHSTALKIMTDDVGHFDPALLTVFLRRADQMDAIFRETTD